MNETKTKIDLRIPVSLLGKIREIAKNRFNAKIHHISGEVEVTGTILKLIELGIDNLDSYRDNIGIVPPLPSPGLSESAIIQLIKRDYEENRMPLIQERIDEWGRQLEQGMRESLRIELDSLRKELEGKMRDDQPIPNPPTPVDEELLPLAFLPGWDSEPVQPMEVSSPSEDWEGGRPDNIPVQIKTEPNSSNGEGDRPIPNLPTPPVEPNSANGETVIKINMDIPTEPNSTELDPILSLTSQKMLKLIRELKKDLKIKNPEKFKEIDTRIKAINSLKGVETARLADANSLNVEKRLEVLSEFRTFITDSILNSLE